MAYIQKRPSCLKKALVGDQPNLPEAIQQKILAAPESPAKKKGDAPSRKKSKGYYNKVKAGRKVSISILFYQTSWNSRPTGFV